MSAQTANQIVLSNPCFKVIRISPTVWRIIDNDIVNIYIVEGKDSALVIDNGLGAANLRDFIRSITKLPYKVVVTHAHPDHAGANYQFREVYACTDELEAIHFFSTPEMRRSIVGNMLRKPVPDSLQFKDTLNQPPVVLVPVKDGHVFDLGARTIEVILVQGHTKGSICLLDKKEKYIFTGDNNNILVWLHPPDAMPLEVYLQSLKKVQSKLKDFNTILPGHGDPIDREFVNEQVICCENIISRKCTGQPYQSLIGPGMVCGYKRAQIVFDPKKIYNK